MLSIHNLSKNFGIQPVLQNINFNISAGERIGLIGRERLRIGIREIGEGAWTIVLDGNKKAIALYESEGFQEISRFAGDNNGYPCTCLKLKRVK